MHPRWWSSRRTRWNAFAHRYGKTLVALPPSISLVVIPDEGKRQEGQQNKSPRMNLVTNNLIKHPQKTNPANKRQHRKRRFECRVPMNAIYPSTIERIHQDKSYKANYCRKPCEEITANRFVIPDALCGLNDGFLRKSSFQYLPDDFSGLHRVFRSN